MVYNFDLKFDMLRRKPYGNKTRHDYLKTLAEDAVLESSRHIGCI